MSNGALNALVAEKVMGWKRVSEQSGWLPQLGDDEYWEGAHGEGRKRVEHWNPSTDLNDAATALERAAAALQSGYSIYKFTESKKSYNVEIDEDHRTHVAETLPMAMCLCALVASGVHYAEIRKVMRA